MINPKLKKLHDEWLVEATIDDMQEKMNSGELTSQELVLMYLHRISILDKQGVGINSVLEINPDALHIASALDSERQTKGVRGNLHGIPVLLKDNIDTKDKMHTSAGSVALEDSIALEDSHIVKLLREAGAVILGKTNMTEWANFMTEGMPSGYSSRGGQTLNPYGPGKFDVGGSSAGSGAAIAANFAAVAVGTETSGSIINPASQNSLVGIKPTVGLTSRRGIIPIAHSQDVAGPMARTVTDAVYLLNVLTGQDEGDPITFTNTQLKDTDFTKFLTMDHLKGTRIGVARDYFSELSEEEAALIDKGISRLRELGVEVVDNITFPSANMDLGYDVLSYEFKPDLNAYLNRLAPNIDIRSLKDVIEFNKKNPEKMLKYGQTVLIDSEKTTGSLTEEKYISALEKDLYFTKEQGIDFALEKYELDAILIPKDFGGEIPAKAGYPCITVPAGYTGDGEPVGITFTGTAYSEPTLIELAFSYEQSTSHRKPPAMATE